MAGVPPPGAPPPAVVGAAAFALNPAQAIVGPVNMSTREGVKYYTRATASLNVDDERFDCEAQGLHIFLKLFKERAREFGWTDAGGGVLMIPPNPANPLVGVPTLAPKQELHKTLTWCTIAS